MDSVANRLDAKIDSRIGGLRREITAMRDWAIALYVTLAAGVFTTMARGFGWL